MHQMLEDKLLIWKFKLGDNRALHQIYEKYKNDMLKLAIALAGDVNTAEDAVEEVFTAFAQSGQTIRVSGNLKKFLLTCVANKIRNQKRDRQRQQSALDGSAEPVSDSDRPERWAILSEEMKILSSAMAQLAYEQSEVITLYIHADMTFRQIAKIQNASINTVQGRYRYGISKLRTILNGKV
jgi:RNA polymerase sigma-70 factor, ECF subfamily